MAIISVEELFGERTASEDNNGVREYHRAWQVIVDDANTSAKTVKLASGVPRVRDAYVTGDAVDLGALVKSVDASEKDGPFIWQVDVDYSSQQTEAGKEEENPLARPATIRWGRVGDSEPMTVDLDGNAVVSSSGPPFDQSPTRRSKKLTLVITKNEETYDPDFALEFQDAVNADVFFGFLPGKVQCGAITGDSQNENGVFFYQVTYPFEISARGWQPKILDRSFHFLDASDNLRTFEEKEGRPMPDAQLLNGFGRPLFKPGRTGLGADVATFAREKTLAAPCSASDTEITLTSDPANFGLVPYIVTIDSEQCKVTAASSVTNKITVERGYNGTRAAAHGTSSKAVTGPVYLHFREFPELPFADLQLP